MDRSKPKGPDYLVMDAFMDIFQLDLFDLVKAKSEAEGVTEEYCEYARQSNLAMDRCDNIMWLKDLETYEDSSISKIYKHVR